MAAWCAWSSSSLLEPAWPLLATAPFRLFLVKLSEGVPVKEPV
jgi:hypothetical protein